MKEFNNLKYSQEEGIGILTISRPKALSALNTELLMELHEAIDLIAKNEALNLLIITGEGKAFVAGADIAQMKDFNSEADRVFEELGSSLFRKIELLKIPVIAAVNGFALGGGCELALCCDIRVASENAKFGQPEVGLGIIPGFSGCESLPRVIGAAKAKELIFTGDLISASKAEKIGLVNKTFSSKELILVEMTMAKKIAARAQLAVRYSKMAINRGLESYTDTAIAFENQVFGLCFVTEDQKEGMSAFVEKHDANFKFR